MPRRRYRKRRYTKKKPKYGYFGRFGSDATKAMRMAGKALAMLNTENKYRDYNTTISNQTTTATIVQLFPISQGTDNINRIGDNLRVKSIGGRFQVHRNSSSTQPTNLRIIIGVDHQSNGS